MTALCYDEKESKKKNSEEIAFAATVRFPVSSINFCPFDAPPIPLSYSNFFGPETTFAIFPLTRRHTFRRIGSKIWLQLTLNSDCKRSDRRRSSARWEARRRLRVWCSRCSLMLVKKKEVVRGGKNHQLFWASSSRHLTVSVPALFL